MHFISHCQKYFYGLLPFLTWGNLLVSMKIYLLVISGQIICWISGHIQRSFNEYIYMNENLFKWMDIPYLICSANTALYFKMRFIFSWKPTSLIKWYKYYSSCSCMWNLDNEWGQRYSSIINKYNIKIVGTLNMIIKTIYFTILGLRTKYNIITKTGFGIELLQCEEDLCKSKSYTSCFILAMRNKTLVSRTTSKMTH